ncbi:hypothetical protein LCGC14_2781130 [marine sediment metagenome]|uniref:Uncharacterized protein n=1 Tax=marine sediment metagenome TaxID=412755 RepID=A0A0F9BJT7_9ZZZZ
MHYLCIEADNGDLVDLIALCSDFCARRYALLTGVPYHGWNGCHELEFTQPCEQCGTTMMGIQA